ncbi:DUF4956 domain-containing protein [Flavobacteriaceae bacterium]|jgi:hypothetical protein|nr:DUF4956 domain-containing protein [Flavobacteriaceae bacterium]|tara:strand:- start:1723 stop:2319 length:597 start_codon:yes stop_codon:yes gene_type:complete
MELLGIPLFDDDFYKMIIRFLLNLFFLTAVVKFIYYKRSQKKEYLFTFYLIGIVVFFLCFTLKKYELDLGMALGLFAIFGILRYRTQPLEVREMTYLFVVIGIAVMNGLSNKKMSYAEIIAANSIIVVALYTLERYWARTEVFSKEVLYETIENIRPENHDKLKEDLEKRLGVTVTHFEIGNVNFLRDVAKITVHYKY